MTAVYAYHTLTLPRGRPAWQTFGLHANGATARSIEASGGEWIGVFSPQLGFASNEAVAVVRWPRGELGPSDALVDAPEVVSAVHDTLHPTVRPRPGQTPRAGGIYVHRWFTIDGGALDEFIQLSNRAWSGFEGAYDTEIFGLFAAEASAADLNQDQRRLLLLTWYASHGVWEASREQTIDPEGLFVRRHALTRSTVGRSSLLVPRG